MIALHESDVVKRAEQIMDLIYDGDLSKTITPEIFAEWYAAIYRVATAMTESAMAANAMNMESLNRLMLFGMKYNVQTLPGKDTPQA